MQERLRVLGIVLKAEPIGEYDRRIVLLTKERGKISAFARGARKPTSAFLASTAPFTFGSFELFEGRSSYSVCEIAAESYFEQLREDFEGACYGMYFLELCDYCTRENNDEREVLKLLYQSLRALSLSRLDNRLVRAVFEIKLVVLNGEFPGLPAGDYLPAALYAVEFIASTPVEKLYTFTVTSQVLEQLALLAKKYREDCLPGRFKSLEILREL
ncbi:MAG: DNA repair protein RecO [Eubacteriales bacterium]|nr:DNA repair protein RecO [Eubacteriales bacterium]